MRSPQADLQVPTGTPVGDLGDNLGTSQGHLQVPELLSIRAAADWLGLSGATLYRMIRNGTLPVPVFGAGTRMKLARRQLERWLNGELAPVVATPATDGHDDGDGEFVRWMEARDGASASTPDRLSPPTRDRVLREHVRTR